MDGANVDPIGKGEFVYSNLIMMPMPIITPKLPLAKAALLDERLPSVQVLGTSGAGSEIGVTLTKGGASVWQVNVWTNLVAVSPRNFANC